MTPVGHLAVKLGIGGDFTSIRVDSGMRTIRPCSRQDEMPWRRLPKTNRASGRMAGPGFHLRVVPNTLRTCGVQVEPYRWLTPWTVDEEHLAGVLPALSGRRSILHGASTHDGYLGNPCPAAGVRGGRPLPVRRFTAGPGGVVRRLRDWELSQMDGGSRRGLLRAATAQPRGLPDWRIAKWSACVWPRHS